MKKIIATMCCFLMVALAGSAFAGEKEDGIMKLEHSIWDMVHKKDLKGFASHMSDSMVDVEPDGRLLTMTEMVKNLESFTLHSYELSEMKVTWVQDSALLTYKATVKGAMGEMEISGDFRCSSLWTKKGDGWVGQFHQETPIVQMPMPEKK